MPALQAFQHSLHPPCLQHNARVNERSPHHHVIISALQRLHGRQARGDVLHEVRCQAKKGFGAGGSKKSKIRLEPMPVSDGRGHHNDSSSEQPRLFSEDRRLLLQRRQSLPVLEEEDPDWIRVGRLSDFKNGKQTRAVILPDNSAIVLYRTSDDEVYCSDANSTAYKFPMIDANVIEREDGPAAEVPLDGTVYDLETGKVLVWCPKNNPLRFLLGSLKSSESPKPLKMYPARVNRDGQIFAKFSPS